MLLVEFLLFGFPFNIIFFFLLFVMLFGLFTSFRNKKRNRDTLNDIKENSKRFNIEYNERITEHSFVCKKAINSFLLRKGGSNQLVYEMTGIKD